jgi:DNA-binding NarL/FixJ family response regulator
MEGFGARAPAATRRRASGLPTAPDARADAVAVGQDGPALLDARHPFAAPALPEMLSSAERAVVAAALRGCSHAEIAYERGSSPRTVANLLAHAFRKLEVRSRAELAAKLLMRSGGDFALRNPISDGRLAELSDRERQAATLAALGHSNKHIAYELGITTSTASKYLERAAHKLGARSRLSLIQIMSAMPVETPR